MSQIPPKKPPGGISIKLAIDSFKNPMSSIRIYPRPSTQEYPDYI